MRKLSLILQTEIPEKLAQSYLKSGMIIGNVPEFSFQVIRKSGKGKAVTHTLKAKEIYVSEANV